MLFTGGQSFPDFLLLNMCHSESYFSTRQLLPSFNLKKSSNTFLSAISGFILVYLNLTTYILKVFPFTNKFKSFVFNHFLATHREFVSVSPSSALLMVFEAFQLKLLWSSWPPAYHLTTFCLQEPSSPFPRSLLHTVSKGSLKPSPKVCPDIPHHPASRYCIQQSNQHAVFSVIMKLHGCMPDRASMSPYHCIFLKTGMWRVISVQKHTWPQAVRSFLRLPHPPHPRQGKTSSHKAFPHLSSMGTI